MEKSGPSGPSVYTQRYSGGSSSSGSEHAIAATLGINQLHHMQRKSMQGSSMSLSGGGLQRDRRGGGGGPMQPPPPPPLYPGATNPMLHSAQSLSHHQQQQQQQSGYNSMGMNVNLSMGVNMSGMTTNLMRTPYHNPMPSSHHGLPPSGDSNSVGYWRQPPMDTSYAKHSGLDLEFGEFLGGGGGNNNATMDGNGREGNGGGNDMSTVMGSSFDVPSFSDPMSTGNPKAGGYHLSQQHQHAGVGSGQRGPHPSVTPLTQPNSRGGEPQVPSTGSGRGNASSAASRSRATGTTPVAADNNSSAGSNGRTTGAAAASALDGNEYSRFIESHEEPDLSQQKIDEKNEKCQFHNCPNRARVSQAYGKFCNRHVIVAPCGFPGCRDKAMVNSSMCEKHLAQGKEALHKVLGSRAQNVPVCRTFGCFKNDQGRGYCRGHEKLLMATGRLPKHINKRRLNSAYTMCSYPDCNKHSQRNHLCRTHGNLVMKQAEDLAQRSTTETYEEILSRLQKEIRRCTHPSCTKNSQRDRLCTMHYYEKHNLNQNNSTAESPNDRDTRCSVPNCTLPVFAKNMCKYHSGEAQQKSINGAGDAASISGSHSSSANDGSGNAIRDVERTQCSTPNCANMSYTGGLCVHHFKMSQATGGTGGGARYSPIPRSTVEPQSAYYSAGASGSISENEAKQALFILNGKQGSKDPRASSGAGGAGGSGRSTTSTCNNCSRESYGRELCESCQNLFAPLVVSVGDTSSYMFAGNASTDVASSGESGGAGWGESASSLAKAMTKPQGEPTCRVADCTEQVWRAGLCETHFQSFEDGSLSVSAITLRSRQLQEQQVLEAAANEAKQQQQASPNAKMKKYFCRVDGCDKQAQKRGLCKRHFRAQGEGTTAPRGSSSSFSSANGDKSGPTSIGAPLAYGQQLQQQQQQQPQPSPSSIAATSNYSNVRCQFPECTQLVSSSPPLLCPAHRTASFCWQPGCDNLVAAPQFCEYHGFRQQCAFEGCMKQAIRNASGCPDHIMAPRCGHPHCGKFVAGTTGDRCRLHQIGCDDEPCSLCQLHANGYAADGRLTVDAENVPSGNPMPSSIRESRLI